MKIRNSLVSNSSSSSFVVMFKDDILNPKKEKISLTKKQIKILENEGFKLSHLIHPSHVDHAGIDDMWIKNKKELLEAYSASYVKSISCNQDDVIYTLVKNKIPFTASVHYGHETYVYPKGSKYIYMFYNRGLEVETYYSGEKIKTLDVLAESYNKQNSAVQKILVSDYIKEQNKFYKGV